jgi:hypothetical protein
VGARLAGRSVGAGNLVSSVTRPHMQCNASKQEGGREGDARACICFLRACIVVFNVEALKAFKGCICKKILKPSLCEETPLARKPSSNRRLTSYCTNLSSVLSICCCTNAFNSIFINRLHL